MKATVFPRIALFVSDPHLLHEIEDALRERYSSLLLVSERSKLKQFAVPLLVITDTVREISEIQALQLAEGSHILAVLHEAEGEEASAAFEMGADDFISHPFEPDALLEKTERYLDLFR